jgi:hypothetical protein
MLMSAIRRSILTRVKDASRTDFLRSELFLLALELDFDDGLVASLGLDCEWPVLHVSLDLGVVELAADKTLGIEDSVVGVLNAILHTCQQRRSRYLEQKNILILTMATWFLAASPMSRSESLKATYEGVVRFPWSLRRGKTKG